jgi:toxin YoeB
MNISWTPIVWEDYLYWQNKDKKMLKRINALIKDIKRTPFSGIGKPEALKFDLAGKWSRRIDDTHRLIYQVNNQNSDIIIFQCRYHY